MANLLERSPLKAVFYDDDIYAEHTSKNEHHYEEAKEEESQEEWEPREKT